MTRHHPLALHFLLAVATAGCGAERGEVPTAPPEPASTVTASMATPTVAPVAIVTASVGAAPASTIPDKLAHAPPLIYRGLDTGAINARSTLVTRKLRRVEDQALLTVETQTVDNSGLTPTHLKPFGAPRIQWFVGSVSPAGKQTTFDLRALTVEFELLGQRMVALNGGPTFKFSEAFSLAVNCDTQAEIDRYWSKLTEGGKQIQCGWLVDKFGVSWQIVPKLLPDLLASKDQAKAGRAMQAMMKMVKLDICELQRAYDGK